MKLLKNMRRAYSLQHLMPLRYAVDAAFGTTAPHILRTTLREGGRPFNVRVGSRTTDLRVFEQVFGRQEYALPKSVKPRTIIDAGANIGCATIFFASRYPDARIIAVEPEASNFEVLQSNCAGLPNVVPVHAAVWSHPTTLTFVTTNCGNWAFAMKERVDDGTPVRGITIAQLIEEFSLDRIDVLKMDIEGGEKEVFSAPDLSWLDKVGMLAIELHDFARPGCAKAFYSALGDRHFEQRQSGDLLFIELSGNQSELERAAEPAQIASTR
jgi:FkbM family methyltransferase